MSLSITWFPESRITCHTCGASWTPKPARGQDKPTDNSLAREAANHFKECKGKEGNG